MKYKILLIVGIVVGVVIILAVVEILIIKYVGGTVPVPATPRAAETYGTSGNGTVLRYVVLGDSTSVAQGGDYDKGYARATARYLARNHAVTFYNLGVSGARAADVRNKQLSGALKLRPDVVLIAIGANDVTHFTSTGSVRNSLVATIDALRAANPAVVIVLTGSPEMGSVPRFPQPIRYLAKVRTANLNRTVAALADQKQVGFAPIAAETGPTFARHPELFAADKFHPNTAGYLLWTPVIERALDTTLQSNR